MPEANICSRIIDLFKTMASREHREYKKLEEFYRSNDLGQFKDVVRLAGYWEASYDQMADFGLMLDEKQPDIGLKSNAQWACEECKRLTGELEEKRIQYQGELVDTLERLLDIVTGKDPEDPKRAQKYKEEYLYIS